MPAMKSQEANQVVTVNGESLVFPLGTSVSELLAEREMAGKRVAVERNGEIVPRSAHSDTTLIDGDRIEIVIAVGGG